MTTQPDQEQTNTRVSAGIWGIVAAALAAIGLTLHALLPRYTMTTVGQDGAAVIVFDRWTGQFQRATYGADGEPRVTSVVRPF
jgi:hypothetical protein